MNSFRASLAVLALAGGLGMALSATPAAAVTFTSGCADCLVAPSATHDLGPGTLGRRDFDAGFQKPIGPPDCVRGCGIGGSVPEPMSWALMILGFGFVGASRRAGRPLGGVWPPGPPPSPEGRSGPT